ncbi:dephospho-CoA kinase [bacterium]|nr:dephospho-CoA kinase [candidate division CSSED10-310 bacterium]
MKRQRAAGLTGGIASGKSTVARMFQDFGARILDGDAIAASVLTPGSPALRDLAETFGSSVITVDGTLNRIRMLDILIEQPDRLHHQLRILAPYVLPAIDTQVNQLLNQHSQQPLIVEAPLLFEYGRPERYSPIIVVAVSREVQIQRLAARSGRSATWAETVVDLQIPIEEKINQADYIIDNSGNPTATMDQVKSVYGLLIASRS